MSYVYKTMASPVGCALLKIPFGETRSYSEIALQLGDIEAVHAVGSTNGKNPIFIVAPTHAGGGACLA